MTTPEPGWEHDLLAQAARAASYPDTPALAPGVLARLDYTAPRSNVPRRTLAWAASATAVLMVVLGTFLLSGNARDAVASLFGFAVENERIEFLPTPEPGMTATPLPAALQPGDYATPATAAEAAAALPSGIEIVPGRDAPNYYVATYLDQRVVILEYPEFDLWQSHDANFEKGLVFNKQVTVLEELTVRGHAAYWIEGGGHLLRIVDAQGREVTGSQRTVEGNTLVWRSETRNYRIETQTLTRDEAVDIAESLP